jgi:hypothetical protein
MPGDAFSAKAWARTQARYERLPEPRLSLVPFICQTAERNKPRSRDAIAPEVWPTTLVRRRAQGKPGARCTRSLACEIIKHTSVVTTGSPVSPGLPCAMVLTVSFGLSPVTGLCCHRRLANCFAKLDASVGASGPHDFAVRSSAARLAPLPRPPHPAPTFVTTRTPL